MASVELQGLTKRFGSLAVVDDVSLRIDHGRLVCLLGPSGCGKTTTLRLIAGLEEPTEGRILIGGRDVTRVDPGDRDVAMVFQSYALYPHMTVRENIAFPLRMVGFSRDQIVQSVKEAATRVRIEHLLERKPGQLSGGQQQRCALARAIVRKPALFLLDEPLSNLDAKLRVETRVELKRLQRALNVTAVYVTHDQEEALSLSDRLAVFMDGRIVQVGTPEEVFSRPATVEVAGFLGNPPMNLLPARLENGRATIEGVTLEVPALSAFGTREVTLGIRPSAVRFTAHGLPATVTMCETLGEDLFADLTVGERLVRAKLNGTERPAEAAQVQIAFDSRALHVFDKQTGARL